MNEKMGMELSLSHKYLKPGSCQVVYLMIRLKQPRFENAKRLPLNVSFVLDRSGSMEGKKLDYTKKAVKFALEHLEAKDTVSLVTFEDQVEVLVPAEKALYKDQISQAVNGIVTGGCTNLSGGLLKGAAQVKANLKDGQVNRVILLTDGIANKGITSHHALVEKTKEIKAGNITVSTLGVGSDFQEDLLVDMAEGGGGNFYFIGSPDRIPEIFDQELQGLLSITGQNLELALLPAAGVKIMGILGYEPAGWPEVKIMLPDMYGGDTKTVLVEMLVNPEVAGKTQLVQVKFRYDDVLENLTTVNYDVTLSAEVSNDQESINSGVDIQVLKEVEIYRTAQAKEESIKMADQGNVAEAGRVLKNQQEKLQELYNRTKDDEILQEIQTLESNYTIISENCYSPINRKEMKYASYVSRNKR
ncbi:VWA domain-containing protein [Thermanaerosceptrum fracticalcis]|uniref:VWA domain-containing protein n=1 Tax=Thermanaerosceptrum fracticalcis TaxID=1712410 RepID=A0A7G6E083_THEFR|nr:VWA domain-containing protein [Thermanaerosceptrum fracticalcis]QNB45487.1 VWA domain-containing protein [Thermanaerosceptrum fracticalcis]